MSLWRICSLTAAIAPHGHYADGTDTLHSSSTVMPHVQIQKILSGGPDYIFFVINVFHRWLLHTLLEKQFQFVS